MKFMSRNVGKVRRKGKKKNKKESPAVHFSLHFFLLSQPRLRLTWSSWITQKINVFALLLVFISSPSSAPPAEVPAKPAAPGEMNSWWYLLVNVFRRSVFSAAFGEGRKEIRRNCTLISASALVYQVKWWEKLLICLSVELLESVSFQEEVFG